MPPLAKEEVFTDDDEEGQQEDPTNRNCCGLALDIISSVFLFLMSIFFIAAPFSHPVLFTVGTVCYMVSLSIEIYKRRSKGAKEIVMTSFGLVGAFLWFIAFFIRISIGHIATFIVGSLFLLTFITYDLIMVRVRQGGGVSVFTVIAQSLAWVATLLFLCGTGSLLGFWVNYFSFDINDVYTYFNLLISGGVFYLLHAIFYTVGLFTKCCKLNWSAEGSE